MLPAFHSFKKGTHTIQKQSNQVTFFVLFVVSLLVSWKKRNIVESYKKGMNDECARAPGYLLLYEKIHTWNIVDILFFAPCSPSCFNEISEAAVQMFVVDKRQQSTTKKCSDTQEAWWTWEKYLFNMWFFWCLFS